jgi:hypothetical protein
MLKRFGIVPEHRNIPFNGSKLVVQVVSTILCDHGSTQLLGNGLIAGTICPQASIEEHRR